MIGKIERQRRKECFVDYLIEDRSFSDIRKLMNLTRGQAHGLFWRIRQGLGWQAI